jgi:crotonobetainyl-CoA:carnitine CoA-transferase CaiB-like acyl-CoA transferase
MNKSSDTAEPRPSPALEHIRVLDFCDGRGLIAGALLAQLGAEVILVEPPGGAPFRSDQPQVSVTGDVLGARASLAHAVFNRGKRSIVVDWETASGRIELHKLLTVADVVLTTGGPAQLAARGLPSVHQIRRTHPHLIIGSISGFGLTGPKADWLDSDLVCAAAGLTLSLCGDADRAPLRMSVPQVFHHAAADAVAGVLIALAERAGSGQGQVVDASAQESWIAGAGYNAYAAQWDARLLHRNGGSPSDGRLQVRFAFPARDGLVTVTVLLGAAIGPYTNRLVAWMDECGMAPPDIAATDWATFKAGREPERLVRLNNAVAAFTATRTRAELFEAGRERRLLIAPVLKLADILGAEQFRARQLWQEVRLDGERSVRLPGPFVQGPSVVRELAPAPELGDDSVEPRPRPAPASTTNPPAPLAGLEVVDLTTSFAGPLVGRTLAAFGARVIKVESERRPDTARASAPFRGKGFECSLAYAHTNAGKQSLALDLTTDEGRGVLRDLLRRADVLLESSTPGALARMGFHDAALHDLKPDLVVLHTSMLGQTGPLSRMPGYGNMATALSGFFYTTGWDDREPCGPSGAYTDWLSPRFGLIAVLAALEYRRRTGKGVVLDLGQGEAALQLLSVALADLQATGRQWEQIGNRDLFAAPHGIFPCAGEDQWIAVACTEDAHWTSLTRLMNRESLAGLTTEERLTRAEELEKLVGEWTLFRDSETLQGELQAAGVPAHRVQNSPDCASDPQLVERGGLMTPADHAVLGEVLVGLPPARLERSVPVIRTAAPTLGEHNQELLADVLGYDDERIAELAIAGALY